MSQQISFQTSRVRISWRGAFSDAEDGVQVRSYREEAIQVESDEPLRRVGLAEETTYTLWAESRCGDPIEIRHADPVMTASLRHENNEQIVTGTVRFGSHVGRTRFVVLVGGRRELEIQAFVAPLKVSWDIVRVMRDEVDAAWAGLPLAALRPTVVSKAPGGGEGSPPVWLALLRASADALDAALRQIGRRPIREVIRSRQRVRSSRVTRSDSVARAAIRRAGGTIPDRLEARPVRLSLDTPSHRWLAARVHSLTARLQQLIGEESKRPATQRRLVVVQDLEVLHRQLRRHLARGPLADAQGTSPRVPPLAVRRRRAYATAYDALRQLDSGLALAEGDVRPALLDLATIYEVWCALALVRETARALGIAPPVSPFGLQRAGVDVRLQRGHRSAVRMKGEDVQVDIAYSPRFASPQALLSQRPDLLFTVRGQTTHRIVLDAKYRRDETTARYGVAGPPAEAIGALHRYRDAILGPQGATGWIDRAIALFPPASDLKAFDTSRLWTGLADIGIGAIPAVPGQTEWLRRWIERTIREAR